MLSYSRTKMPETLSSQLIAFNQALDENRDNFAQNLHLLIESFRLANREDLLQYKSILQQVIVTTPRHGSSAVRDFFMALSFLLKTINSSKPKEFEKNKNFALEVFEKEFIQLSRLYTAKAEASSIEELDVVRDSQICIPEKREVFFYFLGKNTEIASFISQPQSVDIEQLVEYLVACQQFERELVLTFFSVDREDSSAYPLVLKDIFQYDLNKFSEVLGLDKGESVDLENFSHFIAEYNASLFNSLLLVEKLVIALREKRESIEKGLSQELEILKETVSTTYFSSMRLLSITESMKAWSLQFFQNPRRCSSDLITSEYIGAVEFKSSATKEANSFDIDISSCEIDLPRDSIMDMHLQKMVDQETGDREEFLHLCGPGSLLEQFKRRTFMQEASMTIQTASTAKTDKIRIALDEYQEQASLFNRLHNIYLKELNSLEELSRLCGQESLLEQYKQRAISQGNTMTAIQTTSKITFNRWEKWQKEMIGYLSSSTMSCSSALWQRPQEIAPSLTSSVQLENV